MDGFTTYALVAAGAFVVFFIAVSLFLRRRSRILKAYRLANERSILPVAQNPVPGATVPFDSVTPGPNTPGSGNVGFLSVRHPQSLPLDSSFGVLTRCRGYGNSTRILPPFPEEIR